MQLITHSPKLMKDSPNQITMLYMLFLLLQEDEGGGAESCHPREWRLWKVSLENGVDKKMHFRNP